MQTEFQFPARFVRQNPDPNITGSKVWTLTVNATDVPEGLPLFNPREQDIDRSLYREIGDHLRGERGEPLFYLMNRGITITAGNVTVERHRSRPPRSPDADSESADHYADFVTLAFDHPTQGIVDGGHTYRLLLENKSVLLGRVLQSCRPFMRAAFTGRGLQHVERYMAYFEPFREAVSPDVSPAECQERMMTILLGEDWRDVVAGEPQTAEVLRQIMTESRSFSQYVKLQIHTGLPAHVVHEMARGLNTGIQVTDSTMADFQGMYDWIKDELREMPYFGTIRFRQNAEGLVDVDDIIRTIEAFNVIAYPGTDGEHPISAASEKRKTVRRYLANVDQFRSFRPILRDLLRLQDLISFEAWELWRNAKSAARAGRAPMIFNSKATAQHAFPFLQRRRHLPLYDGTLFPIMSAFRCLITVQDGQARWKTSFDDVCALWHKIGFGLLEATHRTAQDKDGAISAVARDRNLWEILFHRVLSASLSPQQD